MEGFRHPIIPPSGGLRRADQGRPAIAAERLRKRAHRQVVARAEVDDVLAAVLAGNGSGISGRAANETPPAGDDMVARARRI